MANHIFLTGPKRIGKSTAIRKALALLEQPAPLSLGGFLTYWDDTGEPSLYIADASGRTEPSLLAVRREAGMSLLPGVFDERGAALLQTTEKAHLILMDELGFLEQDSPRFQAAALACLEGDVPVLGVLREGDVPWHAPIKAHDSVTVYLVSQENRDALPSMIADALRRQIF